MKNILLLLLLVSGIMQAQIVPIPDTNFKTKLISLGIDTNNDGEIQVNEAAAVSPVLNVSSSLITDLEGIQFFTNISSLYCDSNQLTALDVSTNTNLTFLSCRFNDLATLDVSANTSLVDILVDGNDLTTLTLVNHPNLETLWVSNNDLTSLDLSNCPALKELSCGNNMLSSINVSANTLLEDLQCDQNNLSVLDVSNAINLNVLDCGQNQLATLNLANNVNLTTLNCGFNNLTTLDVSNCVLLENISCWNNSFTTLDFTDNINLTALYLINNILLETVFIKNGSDESSNMGAGSWSENWMLSNNPSLTYVCADEDQLPSILASAGIDYNVNSYCSLPPGGDYNTITGVSRFDTAADGCDASDITIPYLNFLVDLDGSSTNATVYANEDGVYNLYVDVTGTYDLTANLENPSYFNVNPFPANVVVPIIDNSITVQDFCVEANGVHPDLEVIIAPINFARPGFDAKYQLVYKNKGNQTLSGTVVFAYDDSVLDFISSTTPPDIQNTGELTFNFVDLQPFQNESVLLTLNVNGPTETPPVNIDDVLQYSATISPVVGDETPLDNIFDYEEVVVGSYDPNNIVCIQGDVVPPTYIGEYMHYIINFENTGTAIAENIIITTGIDPTDFDINSLQILNASHRVIATTENNEVSFKFNSVNLDTGGHGNILLKLKTNTSLVVSDLVQLQANIYFDYNFPIQTNQANTVFQQILGVDSNLVDQDLIIFPNPASETVYIENTTTILSVTLYNVLGETIMEEKVQDLHHEINISSLPNSVYFLQVKTEPGVVVKKLVKE